MHIQEKQSMNIKLTKLARTTAVAFAILGCQFASAADVAAGSVVRLGNGTGTLAGVFNGSVVAGSGKGSSFASFCLERFEYFTSYTQDLYVKSVGTSTVDDINYQKSTGGTLTNKGNTISSDPISEATAWLYTQFYNNQTTFAGSTGLANSFQTAIWYLEDELTATEWSGTNKTVSVKDKYIDPVKDSKGKTITQGYWTYKNEIQHIKGAFEDAQALTWVNAAIEATTLGTDGKDLWDGLGNVRVLNLFTQRSGSAGNYTYSGHSQDQLYMISAVPEVETYAMMLAGLGLMGTIVRRRKAKQA
jgi:hypothetical protein